MIDQDSRIESGEAPDSLDAFVNRTLLRDAEALPSFQTIPDGKLTAKLAITTASNGVLKSLGAKLAMYVGAAAVIGGLVYILPKTSEAPAKSPVVHPQIPHTTESPVQTVVEAPIQRTTKPAVVKSEKVTPASPSRPAMKLDEGDDKNTKTIRKQGYQPPTE